MQTLCTTNSRRRLLMWSCDYWWLLCTFYSTVHLVTHMNIFRLYWVSSSPQVIRSLVRYAAQSSSEKQDWPAGWTWPERTTQSCRERGVKMEVNGTRGGGGVNDMSVWSCSQAAGVSPTQPRGARTHPREPVSDLQLLMLRYCLYQSLSEFSSSL